MNKQIAKLLLASGGSSPWGFVSALTCCFPIKLQARREFLALANEAEEEVELIGLENEFTPGTDGWVKLSPYGEHPKERTVRGKDGSRKVEKYIQRLDKPAAEEMVRQFNSPLAKLKRFIVGMPIYKRHPDLAVHSPETVAALANDKTGHGLIADLQAREDGFYGRVVITEAGQTAIENEGLKYISPYWRVKKLGELNGAILVSPMRMISGGLTDRPNIEGSEALANQRDEQEEQEMKNIVIGLLGLANEAGEADVVKAIDALKGKAALADQLKTQKDTADTALSNEKTEHDKTRNAFKAERTARRGLVLDRAQAEGRITAAERPAEETALANESEFETKAAALLTRPQKVKTRSQVAGLGARKAETDHGADAGQKAINLANEKIHKTGCSWNEAWAAVKSENAALFEQMEQPDKE